MSPKVFISYSWSSPGHQATVKQWAERLMADGVDVVLDAYDLKEGDDKFAYMERMVTDASVTHVLMFCDKVYAEKADARKAGVGTESQIISKEVYEKVKQSKFLPIVCELDSSGNPYLPTFLKSRIWIDFSTAEAVNEHWEQLVRVLHGKPLHEKPKLGKPPAYLKEEGVPASPAIAKFSALKQAIVHGKPALELYRQDFLDACIQYADALRVRHQPEAEKFAERVLADCAKLKLVRDHIVDWVVLEASVAPSEEFREALLNFLERLLELKARPQEVTTWNDAWFEAHSVFVYETFLYIVAALLKAGAFHILHEVLTSHYLLPKNLSGGEPRFDNFQHFYGYSKVLQDVLAPEGRKLLSPAAELIKRQADRADISFDSIKEAELVVLMMSFISEEHLHWYPQTLYYASSSSFPFFFRATQHKGFRNLAIIAGISDVEKLRAAIEKGMKRRGVDEWHDFRWHSHLSVAEHMNLSKLDTLK
jgi:hypothetical protein